MNRIVQPELLDTLPPADPRAVRSRRDLCRINSWMRNPAIMAGALQNQLNGCSGSRQTAAFLPDVGASGSLPRAAKSVLHITELGAGDGDFLLRTAWRLAAHGVPSPLPPNGADRLKPELQTVRVRATLLDRQGLVTPQTLALFAALGWRAETVVADAFAWANNREHRLPAGELTGHESTSRQDAGVPGIVIANLFLHHFEDGRLKELLGAIAAQARCFVALEPRRASWPLFCCRLIWLIGCNSVTRHDAVVSVRAGFSGEELSALWPDKQQWQLTERRAGPFSHLFVARRRN